MRLIGQSSERHVIGTDTPGSARELSCRRTAPCGRSTRHVKVCSFAARITTGVGMEMPARHKSRPDASAKVEPAAAVASNMAAPGSRQRPATMWSIRYDSAGCASCVINLCIEHRLSVMVCHLHASPILSVVWNSLWACQSACLKWCIDVVADAESVCSCLVQLVREKCVHLHLPACPLYLKLLCI